MSGDSILALVLVLALLVDLGIRVAAVILVPRDRKPTAAMAWLLAIFLIPFVGVLLYLLLGSIRLPKRRVERQREVEALMDAQNAFPDLASDRGTWPDWFVALERMNCRLGALPMVGGNRASLIGDYEASIASMTADIRTATHYVHLEYYIVSFDRTTTGFFQAMEDAVRRGVIVRVLLDHVSVVRSARYRQTIAELSRIGVHWQYALPVQPLKGRYQRPDLRNHRKIVVVDGRVAYVGSQNLVSRDYNLKRNIKRGLQWQELVTRLHGPVVSNLNAVFLEDWFTETAELLSAEHTLAIDVPRDPSADALDCQVIASGPGSDKETNLRMFLGLLYSARRQVIITSPYFVPDESMLYAITAAVQRGVEVQLFVSEIGDQAPVFHAQRSYYGSLLDAGVRIWMYPAPYILHAKHISIDDDIAVIGSSNMDIRSFSLDLEVSLLVRGADFVSAMREIEQGYREIGTELTREMWSREPLLATTLDGLARLTSALE